MSILTGAVEPSTCGWLGDERGALPLTAVEIEGDVCELVATTIVRQTFRNTRSAAIEATYVFPLPDRAGVTAFVADLAGRVVEGRLDERGRARAQYDAALTSGQRAAIAEEERPGVFTMRVGNLQPGEEAVVTLTLTGPLAVDEGIVEYRFPLVVAPRYVAGGPLGEPDVGVGTAPDTDRVPDASRVTPPVLLPGEESPVRLSLRATLRVAGLSGDQVRSTLHDAAIEEHGDTVTVSLRPGERLDRDVLLRWPSLGGDGDESPRLAAVVSPDRDGDGGTWQVTVLPPAPPASQRPRDVVVVLDRSGSMSGWKMVAARRAAARVVDTLGARDRFAVLAFDNTVERPAGDEGLRAGVDGNRWSAVSWLAELAARGGTEMLAPLSEAARLLTSESADGRDRYVVLVTDGQVAGEDEVLRALAPALGTTRMFALGIDRAVNAGFLRRLAAVGAGRCDLVESEERLDAVVDGLHRRICPPSATGLTVTVDGAESLPADTAPGRAPDLFPGVPVTLAGRLAAVPAGDVRLTVHGDRLDEVALATRVDSAAVRTVWARARVRDLEDLYLTRDGDEGVADRIVATSLAHQVLSRFTAFVAVDPDRRTESTAPRPVVQPVERPSGWGPAGGIASMMTGSAAPRGRSMAAGAPAGSPAAFGDSGRPGRGVARPRKQTAARGAARPVDREPVPDAYRLRIGVLLDRLDAGDRDVPLVDELDQIIDDMSSVGVGGAWAATLRALVDALRANGDAVRAVKTLRELLTSPAGSGESPAPAPRCRRAFWRT